jgi:hypothetical protein
LSSSTRRQRWANNRTALATEEEEIQSQYLDEIPNRQPLSRAQRIANTQKTREAERERNQNDRKQQEHDGQKR